MHCQIDWSCRIHRLHLCGGVRPFTNNNCHGYNTKHSKVEIPVMLDLWRIRSTPWLPSLPGPLWLGVVALHHHHHIALVARISLTLSRHSSLSFIALGRSSGQHPVSSHSCWMYVRAGRPAFARPCVGIHKSTSLMISSLLGLYQVVALDRVQSMGQIKLNCIFILKWIVWNRTVLIFKILIHTQLNWLKWECFCMLKWIIWNQKCFLN